MYEIRPRELPQYFTDGLSGIALPLQGGSSRLLRPSVIKRRSASRVALDRVPSPMMGLITISRSALRILVIDTNTGFSRSIPVPTVGQYYRTKL